MVNASAEGPLLRASAAGHAEVVRLLLEAGADKDATGTSSSCTALILAAHKGRLEVVRLLVEAGAGKDITDKFGLTALTAAARSGQVDVARFLVEAGADKDVVSNAGHTALILGDEMSPKIWGVIYPEYYNSY